MEPVSILHEARRALFSAGVRRGFVTMAEIEAQLPASSMTSAERWLLLFSLNAIGIEVREAGFAAAWEAG